MRVREASATLVNGVTFALLQPGDVAAWRLKHRVSTISAPHLGAPF
jgi:hypothetical protein